MGIFDFIKNSKMNKNSRMNLEIVGAPVSGEAVKSIKIKDSTFSEEILGKGMAIIPSDTKVYAPFDGTVVLVADTKHALSLVSEKGTEVLIHVGVDTVFLKGKYFEVYVESGTFVKKGELLLEFDKEAISGEGFDTIIPIVICNTDDYREVKCITGRKVAVGDAIIKLV